MDKVNLISWLHKVLRNCYFLMKLLFSKLHFQILYLLGTPTFSKQLNFFARATFSEDAIYHLVINPTNTRVFRLMLPGGAQSVAPLRKSFH